MEIARHAATADLDVVVESRGNAFYAGVARKGFLIMDGHRSMPLATEAEARAEANRYYVNTRKGTRTKRTVSLYRFDALSIMHERQAEILRPIKRQHRSVIVARAHLTQNISGGILSGNLWSAVQEYRAVGPRELRRMSRRDNHAAMRACAGKGCEGCSASTK